MEEQSGEQSPIDLPFQCPQSAFASVGRRISVSASAPNGFPAWHTAEEDAPVGTEAPRGLPSYCNYHSLREIVTQILSYRGSRKLFKMASPYIKAPEEPSRIAVALKHPKDQCPHRPRMGPGGILISHDGIFRGSLKTAI